MVKHTKRDWRMAALVTLIILVLGASTLTPGTTTWGDDHAAYINEGIAIAEGTFQEQIERNYAYHPSEMPDEAGDGKLVYVWGYPLLLSLVYRVVGFDRVNYTSVIWYKLISLLSLALTGGVLTLFFRRRFSLYVSAGAALVFCMSGNLFEALNTLYSDLQFLFFSMLTLWLVEVFVSKLGEEGCGGKGTVGIGMIYAFSLWMTYETRLSGFTVCIVALLGHAVAVLTRQMRINRKNWFLHLMPYLLFGIIVLMTEHLWLAPATSNLSGVGTADAAMIREHIQYYWKMIVKYLSDLPGMTIPAVGYIMALSAIIGIVAKGFAKENIHLTLLMIGTLVVDVALPYTQGLRYLYNFLPILLIYAVYGVTCILGKLSKIIRDKKVMKTVGLTVVCIIAAEMLFFSLAAQITRDYINLKNRGARNTDDVYSDAAIEAYQYIQENTPEDAVIAFAKLRALYMNTQRQAFRPGINGHEVTDADYFLFCKLKYGDFPNIDPMTVRGKIIADNERFTLYKME